MRIGIDIDGVLTDFEKFQLEKGSEYFNKNYNISIYNYEGYETEEVFKITTEQRKKFWNFYREEYTKLPPREFASEIITKLNKNNEIYIITARVFTTENSDRGEKMRNTVKEWLSQYKIPYDKIIFSPEEKLEICKKNKIDIMIEDKVDNINTISTIIPVICYHANYNKNCSGKNIHRAYNWNDIYYCIEKLNK